MSTMIALEFDIDKLNELPVTEYTRKSDGKIKRVVKLTVSINDETNQFGQNVSAWGEQTSDERAAKKGRIYAANGKVFWTDGNIKIAVKPETDGAPPGNAPAEDNSSTVF